MYHKPATITKRQPLTIAHFEEFFKLLSIPKRGVSERSWCVPIEEIETKNYDLKAVNPNRKEKEDTRTPSRIVINNRVVHRGD